MGPTQKNSKNCRKFAKSRPWLGLKFLETGTEIGQTPWSNPAVLFGDSKTLFGLILSLMGFSKKCTLCISVFRHQCAWAWIKFFFAKFFRRIFGRRITKKNCRV